MKESFRRRIFSAAGLLFILLLAFALRLYALDAQSLWYDEAVTAQVASRGIAELTRWTADDIQPPLYYYIVAGWTRLAGRNEWALRFPSVFFGVLTVALLWAVARRLYGKAHSGRLPAFMAALCASVLPLYVYYAQEARMYTLLTFWGTLAGYALLRAREQGRGAGRQAWWAAFVVSAVALLYTHYFGVFLLVAYGLCWLIWCMLPACTVKVRSLVAFGISTLAIILLYLPWLPAMLSRYRFDASYWQGALKLGEALRHVALSFTVAAPEMMLEPAGVRLLPFYSVAFVVALAVLLWQRQAGAAVTLLAALIIPVVAVLLLASRTPKFNSRYLMFASPMYLLLLAGGAGALVARMSVWVRACFVRGRGAGAQDGSGVIAQYAVYGAAVVTLTAALIAPSWAAIRNWFTDPAFTKAQWRELAAFVRQERQADEAVLLISGHAYPAWDYYASDIPVTRLPPIDILDVNAVLGFDVGRPLAAALAGSAGAWLVTWQDEVVDPVGFVPLLLDRAGIEQPTAQRFWHVGLRHWRLRPDAAYPTAPQPRHVQAANFDHKLALLGWDDPEDGQIIVYWRVLNVLQQDYQVSVVVENAAGRRVGQWDGRPAGYDYPAWRWQPGQVLFGRYPLPLPSGAPDGDYTVTLTIYDATDPAGLDIRDEADNPAGKRARLGPIRVE